MHQSKLGKTRNEVQLFYLENIWLYASVDLCSTEPESYLGRSVCDHSFDLRKNMWSMFQLRKKTNPKNAP